MARGEGCPSLVRRLSAPGRERNSPGYTVQNHLVSLINKQIKAWPVNSLGTSLAVISALSHTISVHGE